MALFIDYKFYVIRFIELPSRYLESFEYVYVPRSWIRIRRPKANKVLVLVTYPREHPYKTIERVNKEQNYDKNWQNYWATVEYTTDDKDDAVWWLATLGRIKPQVHSTLGLPTDPFNRIVLMASNNSPKENVNINMVSAGNQSTNEMENQACSPQENISQTYRNNKSDKTTMNGKNYQNATINPSFEHRNAEKNSKTSIRVKTTKEIHQDFSNNKSLQTNNTPASEYAILVEKGPLNKIIITRSPDVEPSVSNSSLSATNELRLLSQQSSERLQSTTYAKKDVDAPEMAVKTTTREMPSLIHYAHAVKSKHIPITLMQTHSYRVNQVPKTINKTIISQNSEEQNLLTQKLRYFRRPSAASVHMEQKPCLQDVRHPITPMDNDVTNMTINQSTQFPENIYEPHREKCCQEEMKRIHSPDKFSHVSRRHSSQEANSSTSFHNRTCETQYPPVCRNHSHLEKKEKDVFSEKAFDNKLPYRRPSRQEVNQSTQTQTDLIYENKYPKTYRRHSCQEASQSTQLAERTHGPHSPHVHMRHRCQEVKPLLSPENIHENQFESAYKTHSCEEIRKQINHFLKSRRNYSCCQVDRISHNIYPSCISTPTYRDRPLCGCLLTLRALLLDPYELRGP